SIDGNDDYAANESGGIDLSDCESLDLFLNEAKELPPSDAAERTPFAPLSGEEFVKAADETAMWSGGGLSNLWTDPANWVGGVLPLSDQYVSFELASPGATVVIDSEVAVNGIDASHVNLEISGELVVSSAFILGNVTVLDGGSLVFDETAAG